MDKQHMGNQKDASPRLSYRAGDEKQKFGAVPGVKRVSSAGNEARPNHTEKEAEAEPDPEELFAFSKLWYREGVDISVCGNLISGVPITLRRDTMRVVDQSHSYIIPASNIEFIRTEDGYGKSPTGAE